VNGKKIENSLTATRLANEGRGLWMKPAVIGRQVPASKAKFTIAGRTEYAAPILALTNTVYEVTGEIEFVPSPIGPTQSKGSWVKTIQRYGSRMSKLRLSWVAKLR
jgi:hypothetical protein